MLEAALDNYSLYRCSTLSSTAEESITRRLRVTHAPHPDDDDYPYLSLYSSDFYLNQTQKIKKKVSIETLYYRQFSKIQKKLLKKTIHYSRNRIVCLICPSEVLTS